MVSRQKTRDMIESILTQRRGKLGIEGFQQMDEAALEKARDVILHMIIPVMWDFEQILSHENLHSRVTYLVESPSGRLGNEPIPGLYAIFEFTGKHLSLPRKPSVSFVFKTPGMAAMRIDSEHHPLADGKFKRVRDIPLGDINEELVRNAIGELIQAHV